LEESGLEQFDVNDTLQVSSPPHEGEPMSQLKVADLLQLATLKKARLVCGEGGINNLISGINIIEAPDIADWVQGGDVLLTNLYSADKLRPLDKFIEKMAQKKLSALIIKVGLFVKEIPSEIIESAKRYDLPVIEIPKDVLYRDIALSISEHLLNEKINILERFKEINDYFINISLENHDFYRIISSLESFIGNPVVLYDKNFQCLFSTNSSLNKFTPSKRSVEELPYYAQEVTFPDFDERLYRQFIFPIKVSNDVKLYLVINKIYKEIAELQFIAIESAINSLALDFIKQRAVIEVEKQFRSDLITDLLSGKKLSIEDVYRRANLLQWDLRRKYAVVVFNIVPMEGKLRNVKIINKGSYDFLYEIVNMFTLNLPIQQQDDRLIMLWDVSSYTGKDWEWHLKQKLFNLQTAWRAKEKGLTVHAGVGGIAETVIDIARSYREAQDALEIKHAIVLEGDFILFSEIGIFRMLCQYADRSQLEEFVPASLKKLLSVKAAIRDDLLKTLSIYLKNRHNIIETSRNLGVHHKTVAYRIEKIKTVSGMNFEDYEEMLMVQIGFKILTMLDSEVKNYM